MVLVHEVTNLKEEFRNLTGARQLFEKANSASDRLFFTPTVYSIAKIAEAVHDALKHLRVDHQLSYVERRLDEEPDDRPLALKEHVHWSEAVSKWCLTAALIIPALQLFLVAIAEDVTRAPTATVHICLSTFAVAMACVSAGVRAYQAGTGAEAEIDSYEIYMSHLESIREEFLRTKNDSRGMVLALRDLELASERELRRFLKIKRKASFLFA